TSGWLVARRRSAMRRRGAPGSSERRALSASGRGRLELRKRPGSGDALNSSAPIVPCGAAPGYPLVPIKLDSGRRLAEEGVDGENGEPVAQPQRQVGDVERAEEQSAPVDDR